MALSAGTRLGPYKILALLGAGGMGEVYRAKDTRLDRTVAIKVLPAHLSASPELRRRLEREARAISYLNHPHICTLHDVGREDEIDFLVMEYLPGESLADRLGKGPLPLDQVLHRAAEIAEALHAAHGRGIVHRDLKPGNVVLTRSGAKLLDFGLAKLREADSGEGSEALAALPAEAPPITDEGVIPGTYPYMAPERLEGKDTDARTDLFALGAVIYEMATGDRAFKGDSQASLIAAIEKDEVPSLVSAQPAMPAALDRLVHRCLRKDPQERYQSAYDVALRLREIAEADGEAELRRAARRTRRWVIPALAVVAGTALLALALTLWAPWAGPPTPLPLRLAMKLGPDLALDAAALGYGPAAILSPDGTHLAFVAKGPGGASGIYVRPLDQIEARLLSGTAGARSPFFSPDGQWIGFFAGGELQKIALAGGAAVTLAAASEDRGASWGEDGTIVLAPRPGRGIGLRRVSSSGGEIQTLTTPDPEPDEVTHRWPQALVGGRVLYTAYRVTGGYEGASLVMEVFPDGPRKVVHRGGYHGRYLPSGHLAFIHQGTLFAAPFDLERMEVTGPPVSVIEDVATSTFAGAQFSFSDTGTLVYLAGEGVVDSPIHWLGRDGATALLRNEPARWYNPRFSPDGGRLAMQIHDGTQSDIWIYEWSRDTLTRLTFDPVDEVLPVWTPDGRHVAFSRGENSVPNLYWRASDGSGGIGRLTESENQQIPSSWHPSGRSLAFMEETPSTGFDVKILEMEGDGASGWTAGATTAFVEDRFVEIDPAFSPDGRFLAYSSDESGRHEIYVRPFPGPGGKWQVSARGGRRPRWSKTRPELLFETESGEIMAASYTVAEGSFRAERPAPWSDVRFQPDKMERRFDLHPDGERVALRLSADETGAAAGHVVVVFNFFDELRRLTAEGGED